MTAIKLNTLVSVSSPMLYWMLDDGELNGTATSAVSHPASTYSISLDLIKTVNTQWDNTSYWEGDITAEEFVQTLWSAHPTEFDAVFKIGTGCALLWFQVDGVTAAAAGAVFQAGLNNGSGHVFGTKVIVNNGKLQCIVMGEGGVSGTGVNTTNVVIKGAGDPTSVAFLIDNRGDGDNTIFAYDNAAGGVSVTTTTLGNVGSIDIGAPSAGKVVNIGSQVAAGGAEYGFYNRSVRRLGFINFGDDMPRNIDKIITDLLKNNGLLVPSMEGI